MATLLETLQQRLAQSAQPQTVEPKMNIQEVLAAKAGKAGPVKGIAASDVGAGIAADISNQSLKQQGLTGQLQATALGQQAAGVQQQADLSKQKLASQENQFQGSQAANLAQVATQTKFRASLEDQQRTANEAMKTEGMQQQATLALQKMAADRDISRDNIFAEATAENKMLADRQDASDLEQKAFLLALSDKSYVDGLKKVGDLRRLQDNVAFAEEAQKIALGDQLSTMVRDLGFQGAEAQKDRDFKERLAALDVETLLQMSDLMVSQANQQAMWEGIGTVASQAPGVYDKYKQSQTPTEGAT